MNRRLRNSIHNMVSAEDKILSLYIEAAQLKLWKEKEVAQLTAARDFHIDQVNRLRSASAADQTRLAGVWQALSAAREHISFLTAEIESMSASYSWRLTRPIRAVSALLNSRRSGELPTPAATSLNGLAPSESPHSTSVPGVTFRGDSPPSAPDTAPPVQSPTAYLLGGKAAWDAYGESRLTEFFNNRERIPFPSNPKPTLTIVLVSYHNSHLLLLSLLSIKQHADVSYEVIIVDNDSDVRTQTVLDHIDHATIIRNTANRGFSGACMQGASQSRGDYLCFLNSDVLLEQSSLRQALKDFEDDATIGAIGGRVLLADGRLQEAGSVLWCDGTTSGYGRGDDANRLQYLFRRPVDYCSGAFLITPRQLFEEVGGFDEMFAPGYYEDVDYCMRLWTRGRRVVYEPLCTVHHYENASSVSKAAALTHVIANHLTFCRRWRQKLSAQYEPIGENIHAASIAASDNDTRTLFLAEQVPHLSAGGAPTRRWAILKQLAAKGHVTCAAVVTAPGREDYVDIPREVELVDATSETHAVLHRYIGDYDLIWVCGEDNLKHLSSALPEADGLHVQIILDVGANDSRIPEGLFEEGMPSKGFGSVSERELVISQRAAGQPNNASEGPFADPQRSVRIWVFA